MRFRLNHAALRRFCGACELGGEEQRPQAHAGGGERVGSALLAVDHADGVPHLETGLAQGLDRRDRGAAGGDHVLDEADQLARLEDALEAVGGAVLLRLLADDQEGQAGGERRRGGQRDRAEVGPARRDGVRLDLARRPPAICSPSGPSRSGRVSKRYLSR